MSTKKEVAFTPGQLVKIIQILEEAGVKSDGTQIALAKGLLADLAEYMANHASLPLVDRDEFREVLNLDPINFEVDVRSNNGMAEMILANQITKVDEAITSNLFREFGKQFAFTYKMEILPIPNISKLKNSASLEVVIEEVTYALKRILRERGFRLAYLAELIAFTPFYRVLRNTSPLVALGDVARGADQKVAYLMRGAHEGNISLLTKPFQEVWRAGLNPTQTFRLLVVKT